MYIYIWVIWAWSKTNISSHIINISTYIYIYCSSMSVYLMIVYCIIRYHPCGLHYHRCLCLHSSLIEVVGLFISTWGSIFIWWNPGTFQPDIYVVIIMYIGMYVYIYTYVDAYTYIHFNLTHIRNSDNVGSLALQVPVKNGCAIV